MTTNMPETIVNDLQGLALPFDPEEAKPAEGKTLDTEGWITKQVAAIGHLQEAIADLNTTRKGLVDDINEHYDRKADQVQASIDWLVGRLSPIVAAQVQGTKKKSISTPCGLAGFRASKPKPIWPDREKLLAMIDEHGLPAVREVPASREPDKVWLNKHLTIDDEGKATVAFELENGIVRAVSIDISTLPGDQTFYVKPSETMDVGRYLRLHKGGGHETP